MKAIKWLILAILLVSILGCEAMNKAHQRRIERIKEQETEEIVTYQRPNLKPTSSQDGMHIKSEHYTFTFDERLIKEEEFDTAKERANKGISYLTFMEGQYEFVRGLFGFEPEYKINVHLYKKYKNTTRVAQTKTEYKSVFKGEYWEKIIQSIEMHFSVDTFKKVDIRAHELTHAFTTTYRLPVWFDEGLAVLVQIEYIQGGGHSKLDIYHDIKLDLNGVNAVQHWRGEGSVITELSGHGYDYSYSVVSELREKYGDEFFQKLFQSIKEDELYSRLPGRMGTSMLVYYMSQVAGENLVPFFKELMFNVRELNRAQIEAILSSS